MTPAFHRTLLVGNPTSGGGKVGRWFDKVAAVVRRTGPDVETVLTQGPGDAERAARDCGGDNVLVMAFGGDGTFNEILNGADLDRCTLAVIPAGTGNVLAKELGVSRRPTHAVGQLLRGKLVRLDVGVCNGRRFINMFGAGLDARVVELVHERRGRRLTQLHYIPHLVRALLEGPAWEITVQVDGGEAARASGLVVVGNTHTYGGPISMTPVAVPTDGLLDVMWVRRGGLADNLAVGVCALLHALHLSRLACYGRGRRITVSAPDQRVPYELDGEAAGCLPAEITVQPNAARVLVPSTFRPGPRSLPRAV
ncbi:MAG: diacylglycerol kinase family lipid kinase [Candidatus Brocadiae bacterium]|nr:diacylglycerol kinase family lipid kinase [Candidatus Brocadiia bacterium]